MPSTSRTMRGSSVSAAWTSPAPRSRLDCVHRRSARDAQRRIREPCVPGSTTRAAAGLVGAPTSGSSSRPPTRASIPTTRVPIHRLRQLLRGLGSVSDTSGGARAAHQVDPRGRPASAMAHKPSPNSLFHGQLYVDCGGAPERALPTAVWPEGAQSPQGDSPRSLASTRYN